jgi:hypothetical protein
MQYNCHKSSPPLSKHFFLNSYFSIDFELVKNLTSKNYYLRCKITLLKSSIRYVNWLGLCNFWKKKNFWKFLKRHILRRPKKAKTHSLDWFPSLFHEALGRNGAKFATFLMKTAIQYAHWSPRSFVCVFPVGSSAPCKQFVAGR